jgi:hypothetical protein
MEGLVFEIQWGQEIFFSTQPSRWAMEPRQLPFCFGKIKPSGNSIDHPLKKKKKVQGR